MSNQVREYVRTLPLRSGVDRRLWRAESGRTSHGKDTVQHGVIDQARDGGDSFAACVSSKTFIERINVALLA